MPTTPENCTNLMYDYFWIKKINKSRQIHNIVGDGLMNQSKTKTVHMQVSKKMKVHNPHTHHGTYNVGCQAST